MKKRFAGLLAAAMLAATLVGCGGGGAEETTAANTAAEAGAEEGTGTSDGSGDSVEGKKLLFFAFQNRYYRLRVICSHSRRFLFLLYPYIHLFQ